MCKRQFVVSWSSTSCSWCRALWPSSSSTTTASIRSWTSRRSAAWLSAPSSSTCTTSWWRWRSTNPTSDRAAASAVERLLHKQIRLACVWNVWTAGGVSALLFSPRSLSDEEQSKTFSAFSLQLRNEWHHVNTGTRAEVVMEMNQVFFLLFSLCVRSSGDVEKTGYFCTNRATTGEIMR